jgi:hypothetical protein
MEPNLKPLVVFASATAGAFVLHQVAARQAAKLGLPHFAVGAIAALIDYGS